MRIIRQLLFGFLGLISLTLLPLTVAYLVVDDRTLLDFIAERVEETSVYDISYRQPASLSRTLRPTLKLAELETRARDGRVSFSSTDVLVQISLPRLLLGQLAFLQVGFGDFTVRMGEAPSEPDPEQTPEPEFNLFLTPVVSKASMRSLTVIDGDSSYTLPVSRLSKLEMTHVGGNNIINSTIDVLDHSIDVQLVSPSFYEITYLERFEATLTVTSPFFDLHGQGEIDRTTPVSVAQFSFTGGNPDARRLAAEGLEAVIPGTLALRARIDGPLDQLPLFIDEASWNGPQASSAQLSGHIESLVGATGMDLSLKGHLIPAEWMAPTLPAAVDDIETADLDVTLKGSFPELRIIDLSAGARTSEALELTLEGNGTLAIDKPFPTIAGADMDLAFSAPNTRAARLLLFDTVPEFGAINGRLKVAAATPNGAAVALNDIRIDTRDKQGMRVGLRGAIGNFPLSDAPNSGYDLDVEMHADDTSRFLERLDLELPFEGPLSLNYRIEGSTQALQLNHIRLDAGRRKQVKLHANGRIGFDHFDKPDPLRILEIELTGSSGDTAALARLSGVPLPDMGALDFGARVNTVSGEYRVSDIHIDSRDQAEPKLSSNGSIKSLVLFPSPALTGIDYSAHLYGAPVEQKRPNPDTAGSASSEGTVRLHDRSAFDHLTVRPPAAKPSPQPTGKAGRVLAFDLSGDLATGNGAGAPTALKIGLSAASTQRLAHAFGYSIPELGPLVASGDIRKQQQTLALTSATVNVGEPGRKALEASGHIDDLAKLQGIVLDGTLSLDSQVLDSLPLVTADKARQKLGVLSGNLLVSDKDGSLGIDTLQLASQAGSKLDMRIDGSYGDFEEPATLSLDTLVKAPDMHTLGLLFNQNWSNRGPVEWTARIRHTGKALDLSSQLQAGATRIESRLGIQPERRPVSVSGTIRASELYVPDWLANRESGENAPASAHATDTTVFSRQPLPLEKLHEVDVDIHTEIASFDFQNKEEQLQSASFRLRINQGKLSLSPLVFGFAKGDLHVDLDIDSAATPSWKFSARAENINPWKDLAAYSEDETFFNSSVDMDLSLESRGASPHDIASSANGNLYVTLTNGRIRATLLDMLFVDVVGWVINKTTRKKYDYFDCGIMDLDVRRGLVSTNAFLLHNKRVSVTGEGTVNLDSETVDYTFLPKKNTKILSQADPVKLTGPLADPHVTAIPWKSAATTYGPLVFGPLVFAGTLAADYVAGNLLQEKRTSPCVDYERKYPPPPTGADRTSQN